MRRRTWSQINRKAAVIHRILIQSYPLSFAALAHALSKTGGEHMMIRADLVRELARVDRIQADLSDPLSRAALERYAHDLRRSLRAAQAVAGSMERLMDAANIKLDIAA
jgi:hypothetical protein